MLLARQLRRVIRHGSLSVTDAAGRRYTFGTPAAADPAIEVRLESRLAEWRLVFHPQMALGELYMSGDLVVERGDIAGLLKLVARNVGPAGSALHSPLWRAVTQAFVIARRVQQYNPMGRARRNVRHHYDLSASLYDAFLDEDRQYSCAYFADGDETLETAQRKKLRHIASKLRLERDMSVLDIGSGWGGLGLYLARETGVKVKGVTLSVEQLKLARARAEKQGLQNRVRFDLEDYRQVEGPFDRIVSVGMFEHVGVNHYGAFFSGVRRLLRDDGVALIHSIGRITPPTATNAWVRKYIFPGGYIPALSEVLQEVEKCGLWITDIEILRLHYAKTLAEWRRRFLARRDEMVALYDEPFCRMWEFYLSASEMAFRHQDLMVFQLQLAKKVDSLPLTRDYMVDWERHQPMDETQSKAIA